MSARQGAIKALAELVTIARCASTGFADDRRIDECHDLIVRALPPVSTTVPGSCA